MVANYGGEGDLPKATPNKSKPPQTAPYAICRGFCSTQVMVMHHISHIPPIEFTIKKLCYSSSICHHRLLQISPTLSKVFWRRSNITLRHENNQTWLKHNLTKQLPLQRIANLTDVTLTPTLNPIYKAPWQQDLTTHKQVSMTCTHPWHLK